MGKAIYPPLGARRQYPRALRIALVFAILGAFLMLASSCSGTITVTRVSITDWDQQGNSLTVIYRFSNLSSKTITSYWICFEAAFEDGGKQQYMHYATETIGGNTIVTRTAVIALNETKTVTNVVKLNHGVTTE